ncbi:MAG TPA: helix-turn-helix domain-containing protein [Lacisediminihabitans sp.]|uniref:TetR/AcrR family transcriptional regulator n=1 Tax=Lacisediminihabitans sp. TaxID=2787631 RepID=UPI002EDB350F
MSGAGEVRRYAKGEAKRREILRAALAVIAERGYRNSTLQEIADAVGLSKAGVLHYFDSREELMAEVLLERDAQDRAALASEADDTIDLLSRAAEHNGTVPGLVQLYSRLVVEGEAPEHPANGYIRERYADLVARLADAVRARQTAGDIRADVDPVAVARLITAASDGLQLQWMYEPRIDMRTILDGMIGLLSPPE